MSIKFISTSPSSSQIKRGMSNRTMSGNLPKTAGGAASPMMGMGKRGKSMLGIQVKKEHSSVSRHRAKNDLLPMVMDSLVYGPMIHAGREYMKVIVADNNDEVLEMISDYLTLKGCEVVTLKSEESIRNIIFVEDFDVAFISFDIEGDGLSVFGSFVDQVERDRRRSSQKVGEEVSDFDEHGDMVTSRNISNSKLTTPKSHPSTLLDDAVMYNEHMLLVGMGDYPNDRIDEAKKAGMDMFCPSNPLSMEFVGKIITLWRTAEDKNSGISEILEYSPLPMMDIAREKDVAAKDKALRLSYKGQRPGKEKSLMEKIRNCFCPVGGSRIYSAK